MLTTDERIIADMVHSAFVCLGCGDPLPAGRGGHCDSCVEWAGPEGPGDPINEFARCKACAGRGPCWECGAIDLPALGRKIRALGRESLIALLCGTEQRWWPILAHAYALEIGHTPTCDRQPTETGILWLWGQLVRKAA